MSSEYAELSGIVEAEAPRYLSLNCGRTCCELSPPPKAYLSVDWGLNCCISGAAAAAANAAEDRELSPPRYLSFACGRNWKLSTPAYLSFDGGRNCINDGGANGKAAGVAEARLLLLLAEGSAMDPKDP